MGREDLEMSNFPLHKHSPPIQHAPSLVGGPGLEITSAGDYCGSQISLNTDEVPAIQELRRDLDLLISAIKAAHDREDENTSCSPNCWSCRILDAIKGIHVANALSETEDAISRGPIDAK